jgi:hypothetical protein
VDITKAQVVKEPNFFTQAIMEKIARFLAITLPQNVKKPEIIEMIFQPANVVHTVPKSLFQKQTRKTTARKEAEKWWKKLLAAEKKKVDKELRDKGDALSAHFHYSATKCNSGSVESFKKLLLCSIKHWAGIHADCDKDFCENSTSKVKIVHVLSFFVYFLSSLLVPQIQICEMTS